MAENQINDQLSTERRKIRLTLIIILVVSALLRAFLACFLELTNDEAYYWVYAKFPDWSHFDHPPLVGWLIQLTTFNLDLHHEFFVRMGAVLFGTFNTWLIYLIGGRARNPMTGLYASILYTTSFYCSVVSGTFVMPDTTQTLFWLMTLYFLMRALPDTGLSGKSRNYFLLAGLTIGLAMLSKYHAVVLWAGLLGYIILYNYRWLKTKEFYLSLLITILVFLPVLIWNMHHDWVSFSFHEERIELQKLSFSPSSFGTELGGIFFYHNPVNVIIIIAALAAVWRKKRFMDIQKVRLLLWLSLPLIAGIITISMFRPTLPHWSGPAWLCLIILAAAFLDNAGNSMSRHRFLPRPLFLSLMFFLLVIVLTVGHIRSGWFQTEKLSGDPSLDMTGWIQLQGAFDQTYQQDQEAGRMQKDPVMLSYRWFPAANADFYLAHRLGMKVYVIGKMERMHKYFWINREEGSLKAGSDAYYLTFSNDRHNPDHLFGTCYQYIEPPDSVMFCRGGLVVKKAYIYRLKGLKYNIDFPEKPYDGMDAASIIQGRRD